MNLLCRLGFHPSGEREDLPISTQPGPLGGIIGWRGYVFRCVRCGAVTLDATVPFWVRRWPELRWDRRLRRNLADLLYAVLRPRRKT